MFTDICSGTKDQSTFSLFSLSRNKTQTKTQEINFQLRLQSTMSLGVPGETVRARWGCNFESSAFPLLRPACLAMTHLSLGVPWASKLNLAQTRLIIPPLTAPAHFSSPIPYFSEKHHWVTRWVRELVAHPGLSSPALSKFISA